MVREKEDIERESEETEKSEKESVCKRWRKTNAESQFRVKVAELSSKIRKVLQSLMKKIQYFLICF